MTMPLNLKNAVTIKPFLNNFAGLYLIFLLYEQLFSLHMIEITDY